MVQSLPNPNYVDPNPGTTRQELSQLTLDAIIDLYELEYPSRTTPGETLYSRWCNSDSVGLNSVRWNNFEFQPWPCKLESVTQSARGQLPQPQLILSNYRSLVSAIINIHKPYNALFTWRRIYAKHLDVGPEPNPGWQFEPDFYYVNNWDVDLNVTLFLVSPLERLNNEIPKRRLRALD